MGVVKNKGVAMASAFRFLDGSNAIPVAATSAKAGTVKQGVAVVNATDNATAITQLNALLASLRTAGVIAP
ncbi:putative head fiber protein [Rhizobium phage RHph_Y5A]|nr:putative head fiber protein [Rhizobium phage RHph_Y5A]QIG75512.1 putative head fiber protein [Rhizobium phage RHph_Y2_4]